MREALDVLNGGIRIRGKLMKSWMILCWWHCSYSHHTGWLENPSPETSWDGKKTRHSNKKCSV